MADSTIFIVDDDDESREWFCSFVVSMQGQCEAYSSDDEFLSAYQPARSGCLVTSLDLRATGKTPLHLEVARRGWTLPVVIASMQVDVPSAVRLMSEGAAYVVEKPYVPENLRAAILFALEQDVQIRLQRFRIADLQGFDRQ